MKHYKISVYDEFECIGSSCPNTCCAGWSILVDNASVQDYHKVSGDFGQKLKDGMYEKDGNIYMKPDHLGRCSFLDEQNLCEIYRELGPDRMCQTCRQYPRYVWNTGEISFSGLGASCPEVARILLSRTTPIRLILTEETLSAQVPDGYDWELINALINGLSTSISLLTDRTLSFSVRLRLLIIFNDVLQECLDTGTDCSALFMTFSSPENYHSLADTLQKTPTNYLARITLICQINSLNDLSRLNFLVAPVTGFLSRHPDLLLNADGIQRLFAPFLDAPYTIQYENYTVNYLLNFYMRACASRDPRRIISNLVHLYCLQLCANAFTTAETGALPDLDKQVDIFSKTARLFEHSTQRMKLLNKIFLDNGFAETTALLSLI